MALRRQAKEVHSENRSDSPVAKSGESEADTNGDIDNGISEYDYFAEVRKSVMMWAGRWGGHTNWQHALDEGCMRLALMRPKGDVTSR